MRPNKQVAALSSEEGTAPIRTYGKKTGLFCTCFVNTTRWQGYTHMPHTQTRGFRNIIAVLGRALPDRRCMCLKCHNWGLLSMGFEVYDQGRARPLRVAGIKRTCDTSTSTIKQDVEFMMKQSKADVPPHCSNFGIP